MNVGVAFLLQPKVSTFKSVLDNERRPPINPLKTPPKYFEVPKAMRPTPKKPAIAAPVFIIQYYTENRGVLR